MSEISRRKFLRAAAGYGGAAVFAPSLMGLAACADNAEPLAPGVPPRIRAIWQDYGDLRLAQDCPELLIPKGFRVVKLSETLAPSKANPSFVVPQALDGMAAFPLPNGNIRLIRNHEIRDSASRARAFGGNPYDLRAGGGTTSLEVRVTGDRATRSVELVAEYPTLTGTLANCAGGPTPWGKWLSCEETTEGVEQGRGQEHGYVFEVRACALSAAKPRPLKAMGRFTHEAVAVDKRTGFVYETEDVRHRPSTGLVGSGFYRFIPNVPKRLRDGGRLQVLGVDGQPNYDTTEGQVRGIRLPVTWLDIDDPDPANASSDPSAVFKQGLAKGAAVFQRLEGCWYGDNSIFFNATEGGDAKAGQVWQYRPRGSREEQIAGSGGELILVFESPSRSVLDSPDNICVSPRGGIVLCEDNDGIQHIRGLTKGGKIFDFVTSVGGSPEFAGACFSPDGEILFFNIQGSTQSQSQSRGGTYAIWGPWAEGVL